MKHLAIRFLGHLVIGDQVHLHFVFAREGGMDITDDSATLDRMIEDFAGDSLGIKLVFWGESESDIYDYISKIVTPPTEMIDQRKLAIQKEVGY